MDICGQKPVGRNRRLLHSGKRKGRMVPQADGDMMYDTVGDEHLEDIVGVQSTDTKAAQCGVKDDAVCKTQTLKVAADEKHLPCAVLTPYQQHSRGLSVLRMQMSMTEPAKKRLWQSIVKAKIENQAICLQLTEHTAEADTLRTMIDRVRSGDSENVEATAAQLYFPALFGQGFTRGEENGINAGLNYGYAVLRGCIARHLTVYGFLPVLGLHHRSTLNAFNLADDLIEPFRPVVDLLVSRSIAAEDELTPPQKRLLFNCLNLDILSGRQHHSVSYAVERLVQSLGRVMERPETKLTLPALLESEQHRYE